MLDAADVTGGSAISEDVTASAPERGAGPPSVAHPCGRANPTDDTLLRTFTYGPGVLALQRIVVGADLAGARHLEAALLPRSSSTDCDVSEVTVRLSYDGTSVSRLHYAASVERDTRAEVHVAVVLVDNVVTEIVVVDRQDDGVDQSRFLAPLVERAIDRIRVRGPAW
jgi:hypothetical protein